MTSSRGASPFVERLFVHPVKGLAAVEVRELVLDEIGPVHDRRWMVVADEGERFLTQRNHPELALIEALPAAAGSGLLLRAEGVAPLEVADPPADTPRVRVRIWDDRVEAALAAERAHRWLSDLLGEPVRLVRLPDDEVRPTDPERARDGFRDRVAFADAFPLLLVGEESVADVDRRTPDGAPPVTVERFRPNVVLGGTEAWREDAWRRIRIGGVELAVVGPCPRCVVTTVDPGTGEKGDEPLATLARFRREDGKVWVGQNAQHRSPGTLRVGDRVTVLEEGTPRPGLGLQKQWGRPISTIEGDETRRTP